MKRYEQVAEGVADSIRNGTLRPGDRLPSVRQHSAEQAISPATVFQAYYLLEARGLIEARPRSGYYVSRLPMLPRGGDEPGTAAPQPGSSEVEISELVFEVLASVRRGGVVPLGSAFPAVSLFPLDRLARSVARGMRRLDPQRIVADLSPGNDQLRRQIGLRYLLNGRAVEADEIVLTNGALEGLNLCLQAVTRPGDLVAVESPCFYGALQAIERLNLRAVEVATHPRTGVDLDSLAAVLAQHPVKACWFMTNFQNPLGCTLPDEHKRRLVALLAQHDVPLIEDDVYGELHHGQRRPPPAKAFDLDGRVMHCSSFSKCLAPGYRIGWVAAGRHARTIERIKLMSSLSAAVPSQEALADYLQQGGFDRHLRRLRQHLAQAQARALRLVQRHFPAGTRVTRPDGGNFLWLELPPAVDALALHRLALSQGIGLAPGALFSADRRFTHHLRLNIGHADAPGFDTALRQVGQLTAQVMEQAEAGPCGP